VIREPDPAGSASQPWFEDGLRFKCTGCGKCCTGASGNVYLSQADIERLAAFLQLPAGRFVRDYTRLVKGRRALVNRSGSTDCIFLREKTCSVYEARPTQCRAYPWWLSNIHDPESWAEAAQVCEGIDHPEAPVIPASEILEWSRRDIDNESSQEPRRRGNRSR
jgi:Fe-S-cluster containining protein